MLDSDFIGEEKEDILTLDLFEDPFILNTLKGKSNCITITMPIEETCNHL